MIHEYEAFRQATKRARDTLYFPGEAGAVTNYDRVEVHRGCLIGMFPGGTVVRLGEGVDTYQIVLPATAVYMLRVVEKGWEVHGFGAAGHFQRTSWGTS